MVRQQGHQIGADAIFSNVRRVYNGPIGAGLVPISSTLMYTYVATPEAGNPRLPREGLAARMRGKLASGAPALRELAEQITNDEAVVYRPLYMLLVTGSWRARRGSCWVTRFTPPHPIWDGVRGWQSRTAWC